MFAISRKVWSADDISISNFEQGASDLNSCSRFSSDIGNEISFIKWVKLWRKFASRGSRWLQFSILSAAYHFLSTSLRIEFEEDKPFFFVFFFSLLFIRYFPSSSAGMWVSFWMTDLILPDVHNKPIFFCTYEIILFFLLRFKKKILNAWVVYYFELFSVLALNKQINIKGIPFVKSGKE